MGDCSPAVSHPLMIVGGAESDCAHPTAAANVVNLSRLPARCSCGVWSDAL